MAVYALLGGKGGPTKTSIARAIAVKLAQQGRKVIGLDTDEDQASFYRWSVRREKSGFTPALTVLKDVTVHKLPRLLETGDYDDYVIDGAAYGSKESIDIARMADLVVMPTRYSIDDVESCIRVFNRFVKSGIDSDRIVVVLSGVAESAAAIRNCQEYFRKTGIQIVDNYIPMMPVFSNVQDDGGALIEIKNQPRLFTLARYAIEEVVAKTAEKRGKK